MEQQTTLRGSLVMLFDDLQGLVRVAIISLLAYGSLILVLRLAGKRALSKLNAFDLVVTVALGSTLATVLLASDIAFVEGLLAFTMLALLQWAVSRLSIAWPAFRKLVRSQPRLLVEDGRYRAQAMADERITNDEIEAVVRSAGIGRLDEVGAVVLETDGSLSVIRCSDKPLTMLASVKR
jgi:uncharacterized membrane protein YcaP (DUF421 family)